MRRLLVLFAATSCTSPGFVGTDEQLADALAKTLSDSCPMGDPSDERARSDCAVALTDSSLMREQLADPFLWGQQQAADDWEIDQHMTRFHPLVWRRLYASTYMFPTAHTVEKRDGMTLLHIAPKFRNKLDMGSYPYPFWHKASKWGQYQLQKELIFFIKDKRIVAARRSFEGTAGLAATPAELPEVVHEWGGQWRWSLAGDEYPKAVLYTWLLSKQNPHREALETSYRDLEHEMRQSTCMLCHSPDNVMAMAQLELFSYPNQALSGRHRIVKSLEDNTMPSNDPLRGITTGFHEDQEPRRQKLLELAKTFAKLGDDALRFEGEQTP